MRARSRQGRDRGGTGDDRRDRSSRPRSARRSEAHLVRVMCRAGLTSYAGDVAESGRRRRHAGRARGEADGRTVSMGFEACTTPEAAGTLFRGGLPGSAGTVAAVAGGASIIECDLDRDGRQDRGGDLLGTIGGSPADQEQSGLCGTGRAAAESADSRHETDRSAVDVPGGWMALPSEKMMVRIDFGEQGVPAKGPRRTCDDAV